MSAQSLRQRYAHLEQLGREWCRRNPDACPECKCRPGEGDSEQGTDHEVFCLRNPSSETEQAP